MIFKLILLPGIYCIKKIENSDFRPPVPGKSDFLSVTITNDEISTVAIQTESDLENNVCSIGWNILKIEGQLDLSEVGIIASIAVILREMKIPVFVISTFNTDYILVKKDYIRSAIRALAESGYTIVVKNDD